MKIEFLDLGKQPIANKFLKPDELKDEFFYDLKVVFDEETGLVSMKEFVAPELMFNKDYKYKTSLSLPMNDHFQRTSENLKYKFKPKSVLEIGSNDGPFIRHFDRENSYCVEPCDNFAKITGDLGYQTYTEFWTTELSDKIKSEVGKFDLIYSANCICHIQDLDDCFQAVYNLLSDDGVFVFEDPSLIKMLTRGSYDQIYDEHAHVFSVTALNNVLAKNGLALIDVDNLSVHGGSNRIYAKKKDSSMKTSRSISVQKNLEFEKLGNVHRIETYEIFRRRVETSKETLHRLLTNLRYNGKKIISIGATSKSTTVFNYCDINSDLISFITDTTPDKQGLLAPGSHIPVINRDDVNMNDYHYAFLGAWNFKNVIKQAEVEFLENGGEFITHVPQPMTFV